MLGVGRGLFRLALRDLVDWKNEVLKVVKYVWRHERDSRISYRETSKAKTVD